MINYNFLILSPNEFECLSRDLLQKKLSIFVESFTAGRDSGIDLRYASTKGKTAIIQSKRYESYSTLLNNLKKEAEKVKHLRPQKYILTTSVGLTPNNKNEIMSLFTPYILATEDILGKDDLNNLLGKYEDIERKYYKLWLTSTNVLQKIIHSKIYNQSTFFLQEIEDTVKVYVQNESFPKAFDILNLNKYVIISGIPGIGKTTLSKMLIYHLLSKEFEEIIYLSDSIDDGYSYFEEEKKQIFFFDDFLGRNSFEAKNAQNIDEKIIKFIDVIKRTPNKVLIIATREYILRQAMGYFEKFKIHNIEIAKCILDLSSYTKLIKAQILYNHLVFQNIPQEHLEDLVQNDKYKELINHSNYNPRIIETIINYKIWNDCEPNQFVKAIKRYFDNPESVWLYAFENSLDKFSQYVLLTLLTVGTPALIEDLELAVKEFLRINNFKFLISYDSTKFHRALRELEDTFIKTEKDSKGAFVIEYKNPSIQDFLTNFLRDKSDLTDDLLCSAVFTNQFFKVFTTTKEPSFVFQRIVLTPQQIETAVKRIVENYDNFKNSKLNRYDGGKYGHYYWNKDTSYQYTFLNKIREEFVRYNHNSVADDLIHTKMQELIYGIDSHIEEKEEYVSIIENIDLDKVTYEPAKILSALLNNSYYIQDIKLFEKLNFKLYGAYNEFVKSDVFMKRVEEIVDDEINSTEDSEISSLIEEIESLESDFGLSFDDEKQTLQEKDSNYQAYLESQVDNDIERYSSYEEKRDKEDEQIKEIFTSLIENS